MSSYLISLLAALAASMVFGLVVHIQRRGLSTADPIAGALITIVAMTVFFGLCLPFGGDISRVENPATLYFVICGLAFPALAQFFQIQAIGRVGPSLTAALGAFMPLFAALPAVMFLGESLSFQMLAGFLVMTAGLGIAGLAGRRKDRRWPVWALLLPLAAAAARGLVQPLSKAGLAVIPDPLFAGFIMGCASTFTLTLITIATGKVPALRTAGTGFWWFVLVGVVNGTGILLLNIAVSKGEVTVVAPLVAASPLWTLLLGWLVFKNERLSWQHCLVAALVVGGAILIVTR